MEAGHVALPVIERAQRVDAALKADIEVQIYGPGGVLLQNGERQVVTGPDREQLVTIIPRIDEDPVQIGAQGFDMRLHSDSCPALRPGKPLGEFGWACLASLRPDNQRLAENGLPFAQRIPYMPVRAVQQLCGVAN